MELEKYLTKDEKELVALVYYHRKQYENAKQKQGGLCPTDHQIVELLSQADLLVAKIASQRISDEAEKNQAVLTTCPKCKTEKLRVPFGEKKSKEGYKCNRYRCNECTTIYTEDKPNNAKDQLKWLNSIKVLFEKNKKNLATLPSEQQQVFDQFQFQYEAFKKAYDTEGAASQIKNEAEQKLQESIIQWRDYLLLAKINNHFPDTLIGKS